MRSGSLIFYRKKFRLNSVIATFLLGLISIGLGLILWSLNRGFDMSDEAWAYSLIKSGRDTVNEPWGFHWLLKPIFDLFGHSVLAFRFLRLSIYFILGLILYFVLLRSLNSKGMNSKANSLILFSATQIGTIVSFSYAPPYISYNELSGWFVQLIGIVLISMKPEIKKDRYKWGLVGVLLGFLSVSKISALFLVVALVLILLLTKIRSFLQAFILGLFGFATSISFIWLFNFPLKSYLSNNLKLFFDKELQIAYAHPIQGMIKKYLIDLIFFVPRHPIIFIIFILISLAFLFSKKSNKTLLSFFTSVAIFLTLLLSISDMRWNSIGTFIFFFLIVNLALEFIKFFERSGDQDGHVFKTGCLVFATITPLVASFGTSNPIMGQMLFASTLLFGIFSYNLILNIDRISVFPILFVAIWSLFILSIAIFVSPYGNVNLARSVSGISSGDLRGISVDPGRKYRIETYLDLNKYVKGLDFFTIDNPGALFLSSNDDFANPWINYTTWPASFLSVSHSCKRDNLLKIGIYTKVGAENDRLLLLPLNRALDYCSLTFPDDFYVKKIYEFDELTEKEQLWVSR